MLQSKKTSLSSRPPKDSKITAVDQEKLNKFILSAERSIQIDDPVDVTFIKYTFPWEKEGVRDDFYKLFNLRLSESSLLKIEYLANLLKVSKHKLCLDILLPEIDKKIKNL